MLTILFQMYSELIFIILYKIRGIFFFIVATSQWMGILLKCLTSYQKWNLCHINTKLLLLEIMVCFEKKLFIPFVDISLDEGYYLRGGKRLQSAPYDSSAKRMINQSTLVYLEGSHVCIEGITFFGSPWQPECIVKNLLFMIDH